jgi:flagellar protein FliS
MNAAARYGSIQNETASRERLMVMLFEAALKHMRGGAAALESGQKIEGARALLRATDIVAYLQRTLDYRQAPELCSDLAAVYTFVCSKLISGSSSHNANAARDAERAFAPLADAFSEAIRARGAA